MRELNENELKLVQDKCFVLLKAFKEICEKANIWYSLAYGSVLGAVGSVSEKKYVMIAGLAGQILLLLIGFLIGCFVGCLALAIAEMLDSIPIFTRRISFQKGIGIAVLGIAIGKFCGSLFYFWTELHQSAP